MHTSTESRTGMILELTPSAIAFLLGTAVFAATGVLAAVRQDMDALSVIVIGVVTALGGGTLRDLILDVPVFWLHQPLYLYVPALASLCTFFFERLLRSTERPLLYLDGFAGALFVILATDKSLDLGHGAGVAMVMGVITGVGGGLIRDVITGHPTILLSRELYITPILAGGGLYLLLRGAEFLEPGEATIAGAVAIAVLRAGAIMWGWAFPDWLTFRQSR